MHKRRLTVASLALTAGILTGCSGLADRFKADPVGTSQGIVTEAGEVVTEASQYPAPAGVPAWLWVLGTIGLTAWGKWSSSPKDKAKVAEAARIAAEAEGKVAAASEIAAGLTAMVRDAAKPTPTEGG